MDGVLKEVLPQTPIGARSGIALKSNGATGYCRKACPQDGRITVKLAGHGVDLRVSTMPSAHGERVVLRILDQAAGAISLDKLNMPTRVLEDFKTVLAKPHGIILVTGPTGVR